MQIKMTKAIKFNPFPIKKNLGKNSIYKAERKQVKNLTVFAAFSCGKCTASWPKGRARLPTVAATNWQSSVGSERLWDTI